MQREVLYNLPMFQKSPKKQICLSYKIDFPIFETICKKFAANFSRIFMFFLLERVVVHSYLQKKGKKFIKILSLNLGNYRYIFNLKNKDEK